MDFIEITSEIKIEPELFQLQTPPAHHDIVEIGVDLPNGPTIDTEDVEESMDEIFDSFCVRFKSEATPEDEPSDMKSEMESEDDVPIQDSGGVFKDHNYSLFKDVSPVDRVLMTYYGSVAKDAEPVSELHQKVCKILELLGTIVSTSSGDLIAGAIEMIEMYTNQMRSQYNEKDAQLEEVYEQHSYLNSVREISKSVAADANRVANQLLREKQCQKDEVLGQLKAEVNERLQCLRQMHDPHIEIGVQTEQPDEHRATTETQTEEPTMSEISIQTDPVVAVNQTTKPLKYFSSSDIDSEGSASSGTRRLQRRRKKRELVKSFFEGEGEREKNRERAERRLLNGSDDEIDRLINLNNLDREYQDPDEVDRDGATASAEEGDKVASTAAEKKKRQRDGETTEDILNNIDIANESGGEAAEPAKKEEEHEEQKFLKELNQEHKKLLLNSSSSEEESDSGFETLLLQSRKATVQDSSEESVIEETVDLFLTDFKVAEDGKDGREKKQEQQKKSKQSEEETGDAPEKPRQARRDSFDKEMAELLQDTDEEEQVPKAKKHKANTAKDTNEGDVNGNDDESVSPLDLSDCAGKRSRNESMDAEKDLSETLMQKRKLILGSQTKESLDAMVMKVHQTTKNPLLFASPPHSHQSAASPVTMPKEQDCISLSSSSSLEELGELDRASLVNSAQSGSAIEDRKPAESWKRNPRKMISDDKLDINTKKAQRDEHERIKRLEKKQEALKRYLAGAGDAHRGEIILDVDPKTEKVIKVHPDIVKHLKEHQVAGIKFIFDCVYGSAADQEKHPGSGCILAHCMGLGKTLQQIAIMHTVVQYAELKTSRILVICPKSTVMNWVDEIERWVGGIVDGVKLKVFFLPDQSDLNIRLRIMEQWSKCGSPGYPPAGVMLMGHEAFRILVLKRREVEAINEKIDDFLLDPGPDLVICDEGHVIKNPKSAISQAVSKIRTVKRIILTGTPIQNNLKEYFCMVSFIKPMFLGTLKEFSNLYANPIKTGQHKDSTDREIKVMQQRSYVLHKKLEKFVQRREAATLKKFLPEKFEYVIFVPLTPVQERLYKHFLAQNPEGDWNGKSLISDYTFLRKIWTHPKVLETAYKNAIEEQRKNKVREIERKRLQQRENGAESEEDVPDDVLDKRADSMSVTNDWWRTFLSDYDLESLFPSHKLRILFEILKQCRNNGEKCLVFSAFVAVLNVVEYFMAKIHKKDANSSGHGLDGFSGPWQPGKHYYRLDGRTSKYDRHAIIQRFNDPANTEVSCFLISAKAGGMGINLTGANRVVILDTSWNPSNDQQNIFRVFRLGQKKNCYVYRLLAMGTMEEKVYSRSVTKQALSYRVVDEQQIDRHYNMAELGELYCLSMPDFNKRPVPIRPADRLLATLVHNLPNIIFKYHVHDSLLENKPEQHLSEADKREAWLEYERQENKPIMNEFNALPSFDAFGNLTQGFGPMGAFMGNLPGTSTMPGNPFLSLLNQYPSLANDPYLQMVYATSGLPGVSSLNSMLATGNRYFASGSLFPADNLPLPSPRHLPSPSSGKKANERSKGASGNNPMSRAMEQYPPSFLDPSLMWAPGLSNPGPSSAAGRPSKNPVTLGGSGVRRLNPVGPSPRAVPILSPPPRLSPVLIPNQERKKPRILSRPVALPPSTTIEKLPLTATQAPANAKAPILPSVPQSITVHQVTAPAAMKTTAASLVTSTAPSNPVRKPTPLHVQQKQRRASLAEQVKSLEPTAVIDLIDDVIDANPGLTVKPVKLSGSQKNSTALPGSVHVEGKKGESAQTVKNASNFGIAYPRQSSSTSNAPAPPSVAKNTVTSTGASPQASTTGPSKIASSSVSGRTEAPLPPLPQVKIIRPQINRAVVATPPPLAPQLNSPLRTPAWTAKQVSSNEQRKSSSGTVQVHKSPANTSSVIKPVTVIQNRRSTVKSSTTAKTVPVGVRSSLPNLQTSNSQSSSMAQPGKPVPRLVDTDLDTAKRILEMRRRDAVAKKMAQEGKKLVEEALKRATTKPTTPTAGQVIINRQQLSMPQPQKNNPPKTFTLVRNGSSAKISPNSTVAVQRSQSSPNVKGTAGSLQTSVATGSSSQPVVKAKGAIPARSTTVPLPTVINVIRPSATKVAAPSATPPVQKSPSTNFTLKPSQERPTKVVLNPNIILRKPSPSLTPKRPALVPAANLGPAAKKPHTATNVDKATTEPAALAANLTVIQKNLQKRQNGNLS